MQAILDDLRKIVLGRTSFFESHLIKSGFEEVAASFFNFGNKCLFKDFFDVAHHYDWPSVVQLDHRFCGFG